MSFAFVPSRIILVFNEVSYRIIAPKNYNQLLTDIKNKLKIEKLNSLYYFDNDEEVRISCNSDYSNFSDYAELNGLKEVVINIHSDQEMKKRNKKNIPFSDLRPPVVNIIYEIPLIEGKQNCINGMFFKN
jgi:hypothetical protein